MCIADELSSPGKAGWVEDLTCRLKCVLYCLESGPRHLSILQRFQRASTTLPRTRWCANVAPAVALKYMCYRSASPDQHDSEDARLYARVRPRGLHVQCTAGVAKPWRHYSRGALETNNRRSRPRGKSSCSGDRSRAGRLMRASEVATAAGMRRPGPPARRPTGRGDQRRAWRRSRGRRGEGRCTWPGRTSSVRAVWKPA